MTSVRSDRGGPGGYVTVDIGPEAPEVQDEKRPRVRTERGTLSIVRVGSSDFPCHDRPRPHTPGRNQSIEHVRIGSSKIFGNLRRIRSEYEQRAIRRVAQRPGEAQLAAGVCFAYFL